MDTHLEADAWERMHGAAVFYWSNLLLVLMLSCLRGDLVSFSVSLTSHGLMNEQSER